MTIRSPWVPQTRPRYKFALIPRPRTRDASRILHVSNVHERNETLPQVARSQKNPMVAASNNNHTNYSQHTWFFPFPYPHTRHTGGCVRVCGAIGDMFACRCSCLSCVFSLFLVFFFFFFLGFCVKKQHVARVCPAPNETVCGGRCVGRWCNAIGPCAPA